VFVLLLDTNHLAIDDDDIIESLYAYECGIALGLG